jgi:hypothetical protein
MTIVDCHCHAGKGDLMTHPANTDAPLGAYLRRARVAGIHKTILFPAFHTDYAQANRELARIVARAPNRLIGFAFIHASRDTGRILQMIRIAVTRWRFRGIKVHGFESMPNREICEAARRFRLPILIDVGGQTQVTEMFACQYPDVNFIIPHLGSFAGDWKAHQQVVDQLVRLPNVYADTSSVRHFDYIVQAVKRAGAHKILFGSDGPWLHPGNELHKIRLLGLPPEKEALILGQNVLRLIRHARVGQKVGRENSDAIPRDTFHIHKTDRHPKSLHAPARVDWRDLAVGR